MDDDMNHECGGECQCDWYYDEARDDRNEGFCDDGDLGLEDDFDA